MEAFMGGGFDGRPYLKTSIFLAGSQELAEITLNLQS